jgi:hypothetical protein
LGGSKNLSGTYYGNIVKCRNGGFVACSNGSDNSIERIYITKFNSNGDIIWERKTSEYDPEFWGYAVTEASDGGFVVTGHRNGTGNGGLYLMKVDSLGMSCGTMDAPDTLKYTDTIASPNGQIVSIATTVTDITGGVGVGCGTWRTYCTTVNTNEINDSETFLIFPSPTTGTFKIQAPQLINSHIEIFNILGEKIFSAALRDENIELNAKAGIYFVKASDGEREHTQKLVIE